MHHPHHFRERFRFGWQRLRSELSAAGRQRHRFQRLGADAGGQVIGKAQGDCAACCQGRDAVQPRNRNVCRILVEPFKAAAASFAVVAIEARVRDRSELESVFAAQAREPNGGLVVMSDSFTLAHRVEITSLAARYRLPTVYPYRLLCWSRRAAVLRS